MTFTRIPWIIIGCILAGSIITGIVLLGSAQGDVLSTARNTESDGTIHPMQGTAEKFIFETDFPKAPVAVPLYVVTSVNRIQEGNETLSMSIKKSIPSAEEAPALAEKSLEAYGGLPKDARLINAIPLYRSKYNLTTQTVEEKYPVRTQVRYIQTINGSPVYKTTINLMLGEDGEILDIYKHWITAYTQSGEVPIISSEKGFEKLQKGETIAALQGTIPEGTKISKIELGYYFDEKKSDELKPIWVYKAITNPDLEPFNLYVDATQ